MQITTTALAAVILTAGGASAFSLQAPSAAVATRTSTGVSRSGAATTCRAGCSCPACSGRHQTGCSCAACTSGVSFHFRGCACPACSGTALFMSTEVPETEVPPEVDALDGIESSEEAHNADRPARKSIAKKGPKGKPLDEFSVGETISAKVRSIASYGAFVDFGATTDGLLHISQMSVEYVKDVNDVLKAGAEVEVRITAIDAEKGQVALTMLSEEEEAQAKEAADRPRPQRNNSSRRDDSAALNGLSEKGFDPTQFVDGTVVSTVDFGAFVRVDASQLNSEVEGELDGLVHISALSAGRASSVTSVVNVNDKVKVRCKSISGGKVSLTMVTVEEEEAKSKQGGGAAPEQFGAKDWPEQLEKLQATMGTFENKPLVVDLR